MKKLSVVIPVYNGVATIQKVVDDCFTALKNIDFELVLVNDGSTDNSEEMLFSLAKQHPNIKALSLTKNFGEFNAVMCGLNFALGDYVAIIDDDGQNPPQEILKLLAEAEKGYDVVYARYEQKQHSWWRNLGSDFSNFTAWLLLGKPFNLYLSSFKVMKIELVKQLITYKNPNVYPDALVLKYTKNIGAVIAEHRASGASRYTFKKLISVYTSMLISRLGFTGYLLYYTLILLGLLFACVPFFIVAVKLKLQLFAGKAFIGLGLLIWLILPKTKIDKQFGIKKTSF